MPIRHVSVPAASAEQVPEPIRQGMTALRDTLGVPADFAPEVSAAAAADVARGPLDSAPDADELGITARVDHTDLPFVTIDPIGSMDLDQAMFIESRDDENGKGFRVWYAIADVAARLRKPIIMLRSSAEHQPLHDGVELVVLIGVHDAGRVAAELQHHLLAASARLELPADLPTGEGEQLEALVLHQGRRMRAIQRQDRERALGQVGLGQHLADDQRADRGLL